MAVIQLDGAIVSVVRDADPTERGFDKTCKDKQVVILMPDGSTRVVAATALTADGVKIVPPGAPTMGTAHPAAPAAPRPVAPATAAAKGVGSS